MKNKIIFGLCIIVLGIVIFLTWFSGSSNNTAINTDIDFSAYSAKVFMSPTCGCCKLFTSMLSKKMKTESILKDDMSQIKKQYNIPVEMESCHTTVIAEYVIEGHIPIEAISKLFSEKPAIAGIAMPGMPAGSPGMPGRKVSPFEIYKLNGLSTPEIYLTI